MKTNLTDSECLIAMKYLLAKETKNWFIYEFTSVKSDNIGIWVEFRAAERMDEYHWLRAELVNLNHDKDFMNFGRDYKIELINSQDQLTTVKIELLRIESHLKKNQSKLITKTTYDNRIKMNLHVGDRVWFNSEPGIITHKHRGKEIKFTVNVKDTYTKFVPYWELRPREQKDYSNIVIPQELKKQSTKQLLNKRIKGCLSDVVKAELQNREHIKKKIKIKEYGK